MIASAFAYYNYRFAEYKFINFNDWTFYEKKDIFQPQNEAYTVVVYSSNMQNFEEIKKKLRKDTVILAVDMYQKRFESTKDVVHVSSGMNTLLPFVQRFNVYEVPSVFRLKKINKYQYKQDSLIEAIK